MRESRIIETAESTEAPATGGKRWTRRAAAVAVLSVPLAIGLSGTASAAEITPIAEYLDATIASTSESLVGALSALLGV